MKYDNTATTEVIMSGYITASLSCSNYFDIQNVVEIIERAGVDYMHIDIMDGLFVANYGFSMNYVHELREHTSLPFDFHLMVKNPEHILSWLDIHEGDIVSVHYESTPDIIGTLKLLRNYKCKVFVALNPETPVSVIRELHSFIDGVTVLLVQPGFIGQRMVQGSLEKVRNLNTLISGYEEDIAIEVDGNVTYDHAKILKEYGAKYYVCGSSSIFGGGIEVLEARIHQFRMIIG